MPNLWMFYPENDVALASGLSRFTAPKNAVGLRHDCSFLLRWIASEGDVVVHYDVDREYEDSAVELFGLEGKQFKASDAGRSNYILRPWGWSAASRELLNRIGISSSALPSESTLERLRLLSHRRISIAISSRLADAGIDIPPLPFEVFSAEELQTLLIHGKRLMIKAPWSSSGRGVVDSMSLKSDELLRRTAGIIRRQGSVVVEKYLECLENFAMLFEVAGSKARFIGLSVFENRNGGAYSGNIVAPQSILRQRLTSIIDKAVLDNLSNTLENVLSEIIGKDYEGYCGVDMMLYKADNGEIRIAPCVELNLRMTMGIVALLLAEKHLAPGSIGMMTMNTAENFHDAVIDNGRLVEGNIPLAPPGNRFTFSLKACQCH